jgi:ribosomal protein S18 acetylase RimI-like enzyme
MSGGDPNPATRVTVWQAAEEEAGTVAKLMAAFRDHLGKREPDDGSFNASVRRLLTDPNTEFWLASAGSGAGAAAVCQLRFRHSVWTGVDDCWLEDLFVRAEARGSGLGRALVQRALGRATERGCARVELDTNEDNHAAIALYESLGFSTESKGASRSLFYGVRV